MISGSLSRPPHLLDGEKVDLLSIIQNYLYRFVLINFLAASKIHFSCETYQQSDISSIHFYNGIIGTFFLHAVVAMFHRIFQSICNLLHFSN